jgi:hypothetical protein
MNTCDLDGKKWAEARGSDKPTPIKGYVPAAIYYYAIQEPGTKESSSTLGENPSQSIRCLTNDSWTAYLPGSYINFIGSKFNASDKNCFDADITKEICTLILPKNPTNPQPISTDGGSHYTITGTSFYGASTGALGQDATITQDGRAFYTAPDTFNIIEIVFMTNDDGKLKGSLEGNKVRTVFVHALAPEKKEEKPKPEPRRNFSGRVFGALFE